MRFYAIGDIHGHLDKLYAAHQRIEADRARTGDHSAPVIHLGDLVDRGPDSRGVIEFLITGKLEGAPWIILTGNHDRLLAEQIDLSCEPRFAIRSWCSETIGGTETMLSYGVSPPTWATAGRSRRALAEAVPAHHRAFLEALPLTHETDEILFVHAGIRPGLAFSEQVEDDLLWIRREFLDDPRDHGRLIVHGHTPVLEPEHHGNRVNLDSGAAFGRGLSAAVFEGRSCHVLEESGRRALDPKK
ncbi:MAG: metallophosphoesterase family protein [Pseudomonadota bacterium]